MEFFVDFAEMWVSNVSVNLGGRNVSVTKHSLDRTKIGTVHEEVGSEGMAKSVGRNVLSNAG